MDKAIPLGSGQTAMSDPRQTWPPICEREYPCAEPQPLFAMPTVSAIELLLGQLEDLHHAETQLGVSMHSLSSVASHPGLRHMMVRHLGEIERQKERIAQILTHHGRRLYPGRSVEIEALVDAARKRLEAAPDVETVDLVLVIGCIRIDHYEMGSYEVAASIAEQLGLHAESEMLAECLAERDGSAEILRKLQAEILKLAFPTEVVPEPIFED